MSRGADESGDGVIIGREFGGIPVLYDPELNGIAFARGLWPLKMIVVGPGWLRLGGPVQQAVLAHEAGHCRLFHLEWRILLVLFGWCGWAQAIARRHEFEADAFAVREGEGAGMLQLLRRALAAEQLRAQQPGPPTADQLIECKLSPLISDRIDNVLRVTEEILHEVAA